MKPAVPQKQFSDQNKMPNLVARVGKRRRVRIMRAANEIKSGVLHQLHVAEKSAVRHRVAPAGVILMHVGAFEIIMLAVQEKSLVGGEFEPAETERRRVIVHRLAAVQHDGFHRIKIRMFRRPELGIGNRRAGLVKDIGRSRARWFAWIPSARRSFPSRPARWFSRVTDFAAPDSFTTSVFTFTVPDSFETCGVVTNVPYHATCTGAVTTSRTSR